MLFSLLTGQDYAVNWAGEPDCWSNLTGFLHYWWKRVRLRLSRWGFCCHLSGGVEHTVASTILASFVLLFVVSNRLFIQKCPIIMGIWHLVLVQLAGFAAELLLWLQGGGLLFVAALLMIAWRPRAPLSNEI